MNAAVPGSLGVAAIRRPRRAVPHFRAARRGFMWRSRRVTPMNVRETLETFLEEGKDWERKATSIRGVTILRMPRTATRPATLAMEINPVDERGSPMKRKGIMIRSPRELESLRTVLADPKVAGLMDALASVAPPAPAAGRENAGMIEI